MLHHKFDEVRILVSAGISVLLTGEKGSGKTTVVEQVADALGLSFYSLSMTRQTTLSHLMGFMSVNGTYVPSQLRKVAAEGGVFLLDELDAGDANVLLSLNTIENGYISFPDGILQLHEDFRLVATANPQDQHDHYVGRSKLDAATLDRFDQIDIDRDDELEMSLVDSDVFSRIKILREILRNANSSITISMRDAIRYQKRKDLSLLDNFVFRLTGKSEFLYKKYVDAVASIPKYADQSECDTLDDLFDLMIVEHKNSRIPEAPSAAPYKAP